VSDRHISNDRVNGDNAAYPSAENCTQGLSKRELFAAMAMQGILTRLGGHMPSIAAEAVHAADDLLSALRETPRG
jgi:hypothetical protein